VVELYESTHIVVPKSFGVIWMARPKYINSEAAFKIAAQLVNECVWFNIHMLPTDEIVAE